MVRFQELLQVQLQDLLHMHRPTVSNVSVSTSTSLFITSFLWPAGVLFVFLETVADWVVVIYITSSRRLPDGPRRPSSLCFSSPDIKDCHESVSILRLVSDHEFWEQAARGQP